MVGETVAVGVFVASGAWEVGEINMGMGVPVRILAISVAMLSSEGVASGICMPGKLQPLKMTINSKPKNTVHFFMRITCLVVIETKTCNIKDA
jgi:hypothetical protein